MQISAENGFAIDTSVAVAALDGAHGAHLACRLAVQRYRPALAGHAAFETFSVLTRMPGQLAVDAPTAAEIIKAVFPETVWLSAEQSADLQARLGPIGVIGGAVYDAMVGEAARVHQCVLLTRDRRAIATYSLLGVRYEVVGP